MNKSTKRNRCKNLSKKNERKIMASNDPRLDLNKLG